MHRLPSNCPARHVKDGEKLVCPTMEAVGCRICMAQRVDPNGGN